MAASLPPNPVGRSGPALLLGDDGDVVLVDGTGLEVPALVALVAEAGRGGRPVGVVLGAPGLVADAVAVGAALLHLDPVTGSGPEARAAAEAGVAVVIGGEPEATERTARGLLHGGPVRGPVVVEVAVTVERGPLDPTASERAAVGGWQLGAALRPAYGPAAEVAGWEIGTLTQVLRAGARTVRGVPAARFRRVLAVLAAVDGARLPHQRGPVGLAPAGPTGGRLP